MTANVTTLNQIVRNLQEIADKHFQINEFQFGDPWEFYTSGIAVTPVMWVRVDPSEVTRNTVKYKFTVWLLDSVKRGEINETEVLSDMFQVATDVIAQLRSPDYNWSFDYETTSVTPVTEHSPYSVSGVYFNVSVKLLYPGDICRIPFVSLPVAYPEYSPENPCPSQIIYLVSANNLNDVSNPIASFDNIKQAATEIYSGVAEIATQSETNAGVDDSRIVTPYKLSSLLSTTLAGYVPTSRTITINNTTYDLSQNRSWTVTASLGYTAEDVANKSGDIAGNSTSTSKYPTIKGLYDWVTGLGYITASSLSGYATQAWVTAQGYITNVVTALGYIPADKAGETFTGSISATNLSGTNTGDETQNTIKTKLGAATSLVDGYLTSSDWSTFNNKQASLGYNPEDSANKSTNTSLGTSDISYPSQKAVKTYVDNGLATKQNTLTNPITGTGTTNEITYFSTSGTVSSLPTATYPSLTELAYVKGVTSAIQTQLNGKQATLTNPVTGTGTNNEIAAFNGTGSTITSLTTATYPSLTELSYVKGLTSSIQTQLNGKVADTGDTMTGLLQFSGTGHAGLQLNSLTTAQRTALTPTAGMVVFDSSINAICTYNGTIWEYEIDARVSGSNATTTSSTAGNITGLSLSVEANAVYELIGYYQHGCNNTGGVKHTATIPTAASMEINYDGITSSSTTSLKIRSVSSGTLTTSAFNTVNGQSGLIVTGFITTGANSGTLQMQFASGTNTQTSTVYIGSWIKIKRIG